MGDSSDVHFEDSYNCLMTDGDFIRQTDSNGFYEKTEKCETADGAFLVGQLLRQEYERDFRLAPSAVAVNNVPFADFPFTRHTVTIGVENQIIDFEEAYSQHRKIQEQQRKFAETIEEAKKEMERVRIIEQAWYDDFQNNSYLNDISLVEARSHVIADQCAESEDTFLISYAGEHFVQLPEWRCRYTMSDCRPLQPRGRYLSPYRETASTLPTVSL